MSLITGLVLVLTVTSGPVARHAQTSFSWWVSVSLILLLVLPVMLMAAQPLDLVRTACERGSTAARYARAIARGSSSAIIGAGLIPLAALVFLFGPVPGWAVRYAAVGWPVQLLMVLVGMAIVAPLTLDQTGVTSLAMGLAVAVGTFELVLDAIPGIVMRLSTHAVSSFYSGAARPFDLHDQQFAGGVLWTVSELVDLPFLLLIFRQWIKADAREAAMIDEIESLRTELSGETPSGDARADDAPGAPVTQDQPWFLSDPRLRDRFR